MNRREFVGALGAGIVAFRNPAGRLLDGERFIERWSWAMGQAVHLQLFAVDDAAGFEAAQRAFAELRRVERALSLFDDASDLCEINRRAGRGSVTVGADLTAVLEAGLGFERETHGAFNPAVEPLMRAWGFHAPRTREPTAGEIAEAREAARGARIRIAGTRVTLGSEASQLDLGGIGVGYGLDRAIGVLRAAGIRRAFLDVSGDCYGLGAPPGEHGWYVGVADPRRPGKEVASTRIRDQAIATSSNRVSVVRYGRAVRGHVMDPATGWPASGEIQVTVVARTGIEADALSTAILVSGTAGPGVLRSYLA
ncbi:MAG TPA: FAD:protein FMN transferase [Gemmatimonadales bacterium]|jgi:thiamine biosynthesis lipoprotein